MSPPGALISPSRGDLAAVKLRTRELRPRRAWAARKSVSSPMVRERRRPIQDACIVSVQRGLATLKPALYCACLAEKHHGTFVMHTLLASLTRRAETPRLRCRTTLRETEVSRRCAPRPTTEVVTDAAPFPPTAEADCFLRNFLTLAGETARRSTSHRSGSLSEEPRLPSCETEASPFCRCVLLTG
jgi:hypothetical protein